MRHQAAIVLLLAATSAAQAQCPIGSYPTINSDGHTVCQSAAGQQPTTMGTFPTSCPPGATAGVDSGGRRTCSSLSQDQPERPLGPLQERLDR
jgi:hypothetical protein